MRFLRRLSAYRRTAQALSDDALPKSVLAGSLPPDRLPHLIIIIIMGDFIRGNFPIALSGHP